jgi:hypothetical protein
MFPLARLRLRAFRTRLFDRTVRRMSRRNRLLAAVVGSYLAKVAADRLLWRGVVRDGESLVVTVRQPGSPADPGAG